jgi:uncharacterized YigZ family protein
MTDTFTTIVASAEGEFKDKGSKFIATAAPIRHEADFEALLQTVKKQHPKARHHCYAWRIGTSGNQFRTNDDGEPSNTAGKPILGQIDSFGLTDIGIVVVRYFGGTLLGTAGLIKAYRESAAQALQNAQTIEKILQDTFTISFDYDILADVMNALKKSNIIPEKQNFDEKPSLQIAIRQSETASKIVEFYAHLQKITPDYAQNLLQQHQITLDFKQTALLMPILNDDTGGGILFEKLN